jgi:surface carbohydrate biosynthesis protein
MKNFNSKIIIIPIEVKKREFLPKLFLIYNIIKKTNFKVIFGSQRDIFQKIVNIKNTIWFDKSTFLYKLKQNELLKNNIKFLLDEEGPISGWEKWEFEIRDNGNIDYFDKIFFWGTEDKKYLINEKKIKKKIYFFGHPKYDFLKSNNHNYFNKQISEIKEKHKKFILIVSSFGEDAFVNNKIQKRLMKVVTNKQQFDKYNKFKNKESKKYLDQIKLTKYLAYKNTNINIIYRPHPYQDINLVKKTFGKIPKNLKIISDKTITPWIMACDIYIHSGCSTFFEALIFNKKIIYFDRFSIKRNNIYNFKFHAHDNERCQSYIEKFKKNKKIFYNKNKYNKIITNIDKKKKFSNLFCNLLNTKFKNLNSEVKIGSNYIPSSTKFKLFIKDIIKKNLSLIKNKIIIKTFLINFLPEKYLYSKEYQLSKINNIENNEIKFFFKSLDNSFSKKIKIKKISKNVFSLEKV